MHLSAAQIQAFDQDGFTSPVEVFSAEQASAMRARLEQFEQDYGGQAAGMRTDLHLLERWAWDAVHDRRVVEPVCDLLGPDVLLWSTNWFIKEPRDGKFVSMHQDANYWGLEPHDVITAWIALSDAGPATGPMQFLPGSHKGALYDHDNTYAENNLLTRGQTIQAEIDPGETVAAPLQAGQMSLHHVRLIHGSGANQTDDRRIGMVLRFCAAHVRQTKGPDTAVLVAGEDRYGHFQLLEGPEHDRGTTEHTRHRQSVDMMVKNIMSD